jgi:Tol biopolymer transport system component
MITAEFSIKNNGSSSVVFDALTVGGRVNDICPNDKCPDFEWKKAITLKPNETYPYQGKLKLESSGDHHFFTAYKTKDGWNTAISTAPGVTNTIDITVKPSIEKPGTEVRVKECHPPMGKIAFVREIGNTQGGRWIDSEIFVMNADGTNEIRLTNNFVKDEDPDWSPDGRKIAFSSRRDGNSEIYVMNADGTGLMNLTKNPAHDAAPSWSPDGRKIAFQSDRDSSIQIYVMNADGSNQKRLTNIPPRNSYPRWSPNGSKIVFESFRDGNPEIYVMNADGSNQTRLTYTGGNGGPLWSPDGRTIAFNFTRGGSYKIYVMNADGSNQRPLTNNPWWDYNPVWSPDGEWVAFISLRDGNREIYIMKSDGSCQTRLTNNPAWDYSPSFWTIRK